MTTSDNTPLDDEEGVAAAAEETAPEQTAKKAPAKKAAARKTTAKKATATKTAAKKTTTRKAATTEPAATAEEPAPEAAEIAPAAGTAKKSTRKTASRKAATAATESATEADTTSAGGAGPAPADIVAESVPAAPVEQPAPTVAETAAAEPAAEEAPADEPAPDEPTALSVEDLIAAGSAGAGASSEGAPRTRVVVAEDEALIRLDLVELLRDEGYDVVAEVGDGQAAVEQARELRPDLVVMDVQMPRMDGISAATIIAGERIAPVVMLTAFSQRELVERAREAGAMAYVVKPFEASDVVPAIEIALARFQEIRAVEAEVEDLAERLASRKAVDQAKGLLQTGMGMTEQEAFRWIQKTAMDLRKPMREVAEGIISHAKKPKNQ